MTAEPIQTTITPERVVAAAVEFDEQDRAVLVTGREQTLLSFQTTGVLASDLAPREWEEIAAYLYALVDREPVKSSPAYSAHRIVLGSIAGELRNWARLAGVPVGLEADLRAATSQAEERRIRERLDDQHRALERHLDDVALQQAAQHATTIPDDQDEQQEDEQAPDAQPATDQQRDTDDWLL